MNSANNYFILDIFRIELLGLYHSLTKDALTCDVSAIVEQTIRHLEESVTLELNNMGIGMSEKMREIFHSPYLSDIFHGLHSPIFDSKILLKNKMKFVVSLS